MRNTGDVIGAVFHRRLITVSQVLILGTLIFVHHTSLIVSEINHLYCLSCALFDLILCLQCSIR
jgi:hypothetical protein